MAMSLNGMIASKDGNEDFLSETNWKSFGELAKQHGCFIAGRRSYELVQKWPDYNYSSIDAKLKIIVSKNNDLKLQVPFIRANSPMNAIEIAETQNISSAILVGGSINNSAFITDNLIDEVIINIEPVIIGEGVPIFSEGEFSRSLSFIGSTKIDNDILQVKYKVIK